MKHNQVTKVDILLVHFISLVFKLVLQPNSRWKRIHCLSHFCSLSVNFNILEEFGKLEYIPFDKAILILLKMKPNAVFIKQDMADTFCNISILESD